MHYKRMHYFIILYILFHYSVFVNSRIQNRYYKRTDIGENRRPHSDDSECAENQNGSLDN